MVASPLMTFLTLLTLSLYCYLLGGKKERSVCVYIVVGGNNRKKVSEVSKCQAKQQNAKDR